MAEDWMRHGLSTRTFCWPVRVYYEDTDAAGVVYYANYLKFMERARTEWLRSLGYEQGALGDREGVLFVVRTVELEYRRAARLDDSLQVLTDVESRGRASLVFRQAIVRDADRTSLLCSGLIGIACVQAESFRPTRIPNSMLAEISREP